MRREEMGNNGRVFYEQFLGVDKAYKIIIGELGE